MTLQLYIIFAVLYILACGHLKDVRQN